MISTRTYEARRLARTTDPQTSHEAARKVGQFKATHRQIILATLEQHGPLNVDGIAARCGLESQQINKRTHELCKAKVLKIVNEAPSKSGRPEAVYALAN